MAVRQHGCARAPLAITRKGCSMQVIARLLPAMELWLSSIYLGIRGSEAETRHPSSLQAASSVRRTGKRASMMSCPSCQGNERVPASSWSSPARSDGVFWHAGCLGTRMCA